MQMRNKILPQMPPIILMLILTVVVVVVVVEVVLSPLNSKIIHHRKTSSSKLLLVTNHTNRISSRQIRRNNNSSNSSNMLTSNSNPISISSQLLIKVYMYKEMLQTRIKINKLPHQMRTNLINLRIRLIQLSKVATHCNNWLNRS